MKRNLDEIREKLDEGLGVERDIDNFITDWEKNRKLHPPSPLERTRKIIDDSLIPLGQVVAAIIIPIAVIFSIVTIVTIPCWTTPTETRHGWHPHRYSGCLQFSNTNVQICAGSRRTNSSAPIVRYNRRGDYEPCFSGLSKCKQDAEEELNQVAELQRELNK